MGRPKVSDRRDHQLNLSLTKAEYIAAYYRAEKAGMRLVDYGRWRLLGGKDQPAQPPHATATVNRLILAEMKRLGNNLNQLARICHSTGRPPPPHLDSLLLTIRDLIRRGPAA